MSSSCGTLDAAAVTSQGSLKQKTSYPVCDATHGRSLPEVAIAARYGTFFRGRSATGRSPRDRYSIGQSLWAIAGTVSSFIAAHLIRRVLRISTVRLLRLGPRCGPQQDANGMSNPRVSVRCRHISDLNHPKRLSAPYCPANSQFKWILTTLSHLHSKKDWAVDFFSTAQA